MDGSEEADAALKENVCLEMVRFCCDVEGDRVSIVELEVDVFAFGGLDYEPFVGSELVVE